MLSEVYGFVQLGSSLSLLDVLCFGSALSMRSFARFGSACSVDPSPASHTLWTRLKAGELVYLAKFGRKRHL